MPSVTTHSTNNITALTFEQVFTLHQETPNSYFSDILCFAEYKTEHRKEYQFPSEADGTAELTQTQNTQHMFLSICKTLSFD